MKKISWILVLMLLLVGCSSGSGDKDRAKEELKLISDTYETIYEDGQELDIEDTESVDNYLKKVDEDIDLTDEHIKTLEDEYGDDNEGMNEVIKTWEELDTFLDYLKKTMSGDVSYQEKMVDASNTVFDQYKKAADHYGLEVEENEYN